jgi:hypothetical protein
VGPREGRSFALRVNFNGSACTAAKRAGKFLVVQRRPDGSWRNLAVNAKNGENSRIYADVDENGQQLRREILCKKLQEVLRELHPGVDFYGKNADGTVTSCWEPVTRIVVTDPVSLRLDWNAAALAKHKIDRGALDARLMAMDKRAATEWV